MLHANPNFILLFSLKKIETLKVVVELVINQSMASTNKLSIGLRDLYKEDKNQSN